MTSSIAVATYYARESVNRLIEKRGEAAVNQFFSHDGGHMEVTTFCAECVKVLLDIQPAWLFKFPASFFYYQILENLFALPADIYTSTFMNSQCPIPASYYRDFRAATMGERPALYVKMVLQLMKPFDVEGEMPIQSAQALIQTIQRLAVPEDPRVPPTSAGYAPFNPAYLNPSFASYPTMPHFDAYGQGATAHTVMHQLNEQIQIAQQLLRMMQATSNFSYARARPTAAGGYMDPSPTGRPWNQKQEPTYAKSGSVTAYKFDKIGGLYRVEAKGVIAIARCNMETTSQLHRPILELDAQVMGCLEFVGFEYCDAATRVAGDNPKYVVVEGDTIYGYDPIHRQGCTIGRLEMPTLVIDNREQP